MISSHRLIRYVCIASSAIWESVGSYLELVLAVQSRDTYAATVRIRITPARPPPSPRYREAEARVRQLVQHRPKADRGLRVHSSRVRPVLLL